MSSTSGSSEGTQWPEESPGPSDVPTDDSEPKEEQTGKGQAEENREKDPPA
jgi:hypothetical protein